MPAPRAGPGHRTVASGRAGRAPPTREARGPTRPARRSRRTASPRFRGPNATSSQTVETVPDSCVAGFWNRLPPRSASWYGSEIDGSFAPDLDRSLEPSPDRLRGRARRRRGRASSCRHRSAPTSPSTSPGRTSRSIPSRARLLVAGVAVSDAGQAKGRHRPAGIGHGTTSQPATVPTTTARTPSPIAQRRTRCDGPSGTGRIVVRRPGAENARASSAIVRSSTSLRAPEIIGPASGTTPRILRHGRALGVEAPGALRVGDLARPFERSGAPSRIAAPITNDPARPSAAPFEVGQAGRRSASSGRRPPRDRAKATTRRVAWRGGGRGRSRSARTGRSRRSPSVAPGKRNVLTSRIEMTSGIVARTNGTDAPADARDRSGHDDQRGRRSARSSRGRRTPRPPREGDDELGRRVQAAVGPVG